MKNYFTITAVALSLSFAFSCGSSEKKSIPNEEHKNDSTKVEAAGITYICPMKCEGSSSKVPGKCKVCGMDLVEEK